MSDVTASSTFGEAHKMSPALSAASSELFCLFIAQSSALHSLHLPTLLHQTPRSASVSKHHQRRLPRWSGGTAVIVLLPMCLQCFCGALHAFALTESPAKKWVTVCYSFQAVLFKLYFRTRFFCSGSTIRSLSAFFASE